MLRIAMLSKWHVHAEGYAKEFQNHPDVTVTAVWDEDAARGAEWAKELSCAFEPSLEALLKRDDVDAVCVCTPTSEHREVMVAAANAGKHIFSEKVLATTTKDALDIEKAIRDNGVVYTISYPKLTEGRFLYAKKLINEGVLGEITHLYVRNAHNGALAGWLPASFYDVELCGGGAMMDLGAHPMYLSLFYLGEPESVSSSFTDYSGKGIDDNCVSVLTYANGAIAVAETAFVAACSPMTLELSGTKGNLYISDLLEGRMILRTEEGTRTILKEEVIESLPSPVNLFVATVQGGQSPFTVEDGVKLTRLMEAAYRSSECGEKVKY